MKNTKKAKPWTSYGSLFLISGICLLTFLLTGYKPIPAKKRPARLPNIIFILADDLGYGDLGCYGSTLNDTPYLNQMAQEGMRFTDYYAAAPLCSPSRAALLTGRFPIRMGINGVFFPESFTGLDPNEITLPEVLHQQGYRTGIVGKWHLGHMSQYLPMQHGFDEYFGIPYSNDMRSVVYMRGNRVEQFRVNQDSITQRYTQEALSFIDRHKQKPFFLYLAHTMPHVPLAASASFRGKSRNGLFGDVISELDWSVGQVLQKLKDAGLDENTIVVFSSDNGPWLTEGPNGGSAGPLFQGKLTTWEGGQRVAALARWPGHIKPGSVENSVANMTDWFPTFLQLTNNKPITDRIIDGQDLSKVLLGTGKRANQMFAYLHQGKIQAVRLGDWKLILPAKLYKGNFWVADVPAHDTLLVNLRTDVGEKINLKDQHPAELQALRTQLAAFQKTLKNVPASLVLVDQSAERSTANARQQAIEKAKARGVKAATN